MNKQCLMDLDTQKQICNFLSECFIDKKYEEALKVIREIESINFDFLQLGYESSYYKLAAEAWLMANDEQRALNILRVGFEAGAESDIYYFGKLDEDKASINYQRNLRLSLKLKEYPRLSAELEKMQRPFFAPITPLTPISFIQQSTLNTHHARCFLTNQKILKGEQVYSFLFFNALSEGIKMYCKKDNFEQDEKMQRNYKCFKNNKYALSQYSSFHFYEPYINSETIRFDNPYPQKLIEMVAFPKTNSYDSNFSYCDIYGDRSLYDDNGNANRDHKNKDTVIIAVPKVNSKFSSDYLNLLYLLYKCGYTELMLSKLSKLSEDFPLSLLLLFDSKISEVVANFLKIPELPAIYDLILQKAKSKNDRLKLIEFGVSHPHFQDLLALSLKKYPYHAWDCLAWGVPEWYPFVGISKKTVAFQDITLLLANRPELLFMTDKLCNEHLIIQYGWGDASWANRIGDITMRDTLVNAALFNPSAVDYWKKVYVHIYPEKNFIVEQARAIWCK